MEGFEPDAGVLLGPQNSHFWGVRILRAVGLCQQNIWGYTTATTTTQVFFGILGLTWGEGFHGQTAGSLN